MNLIKESAMWDILYSIVSSYTTGTPIASKFVRQICDFITQNAEGPVATEDIRDSVFAGFDYYNSYVKERSIELPLISREEYMMTELMLNAAIELVLEGRNED